MKKLLLIFTFFGHVGCGMKRDLSKETENNQTNNDPAKNATFITSPRVIQAYIFNRNESAAVLKKPVQNAILSSIWGMNPKT